MIYPLDHRNTNRNCQDDKRTKHCAEVEVSYISTMLLFHFNSCRQASAASAITPNQIMKPHKSFIVQEAPYYFQLIQTIMLAFEQEDHLNIKERKLSKLI